MNWFPGRAPSWHRANWNNSWPSRHQRHSQISNAADAASQTVATAIVPASAVKRLAATAAVVPLSAAPAVNAIVVAELLADGQVIVAVRPGQRKANPAGERAVLVLLSTRRVTARLLTVPLKWGTRLRLAVPGGIGRSAPGLLTGILLLGGVIGTWRQVHHGARQ